MGIASGRFDDHKADCHCVLDARNSIWLSTKHFSSTASSKAPWISVGQEAFTPRRLRASSLPKPIERVLRAVGASDDHQTTLNWNPRPLNGQ